MPVLQSKCLVERRNYRSTTRRSGRHVEQTPIRGPVRNQGRIAGLWYLVMVLVGPIRLLYIPSKLL